MARSTQNYFVYDLVKVLIATSVFYTITMMALFERQIHTQNLVDDEMGDGDVDDSANRQLIGWLRLLNCRSDSLIC